MAASTEPVIIANANQKDEVDTNFGHLYQQVPGPDPGETFELRPGVNLLLYQRRRKEDFSRKDAKIAKTQRRARSI